MTTTRPVGLSTVRIASRVSRSTSTKAATGKLRIVATGRAVLTYFELETDSYITIAPTPPPPTDSLF